MKNLLPKVLLVKKPKASRNGVKLYAKVESRDFSHAIAKALNIFGRPSKHWVVLIARRGMRRWLCDCTSFLMIYAGKRRHCDHIIAVRAEIGK
jgi:predicted nucleic acid-binding Zn finger protein